MRGYQRPYYFYYIHLKKNGFFLTKRSQNVEHHKGQISFPGGVVEKNESKMNAAIRETNEEIGVDKDLIKIIGSLTPFYIPVSNFHISPYVGWTEEKPHTKVQDAEVKRVFSVSINDLVLEKNLKTKKIFFLINQLRYLILISMVKQFGVQLQ